MNSRIFLDNNATTKIDDQVLNAMLPYLHDDYGNPSSIYSFGKNIKKEVEKSRKIVADYINCNSNEIVFTSCASESNCAAIMSAVRNNPNKKHIITTSVEHSSILETMKYLESTGYSITYLSVDKYGRLDIEDIESYITDNTLLITVMMANNEIGNIYPIKEIGNIAKKNNILFHSDCVQAIGKEKIDLKDLNIDTMSLSGHKIHAPKGIGILYVKNNIPFIPLILGHQENNYRGGTENVPYIIGFAKAIELLNNNEGEIEKIKLLRDKLEYELNNSIEGLIVHGDIKNRLPNTTNISFEGIKGEELLLMLESFNIYVSTGSACNSFDINPSHVLVAIGADLDNKSPIRISLSRYTTKEEIDIFIKRLVNIVQMFKKRSNK